VSSDPAPPADAAERASLVCERCGGTAVRRSYAKKGNPFFGGRTERWTCRDCGLDLGEATPTSAPSSSKKAPW
jgi:hypothetical protein